ncbi:hypothetical protein K457DRAFT_832050 [Linnemannia elongata AG-77]|uniref:Uncharacterized protein n=1 Tax=Linnemannia elongata AG-77 TaxID=1314771 RepID=A0A197JHA5_9FUNG|nr:hypothetical protein K457DRAFT_832050 [Linnemannia elongata AG-77]
MWMSLAQKTPPTPLISFFLFSVQAQGDRSTLSSDISFFNHINIRVFMTFFLFFFSPPMTIQQQPSDPIVIPLPSLAWLFFLPITIVILLLLLSSSYFSHFLSSHSRPQLAIRTHPISTPFSYQHI